MRPAIPPPSDPADGSVAHGDRRVISPCFGLADRPHRRRLRKGVPVPPRGGEWHAASVAELLTFRSAADRSSAAEVTRKLRDAGQPLRQIALLLVQEATSLRAVVPGTLQASARFCALCSASPTAPM